MIIDYCVKCYDKYVSVIYIKMFFQFVVLALAAAVCAAPQNPQDVQILRYDTNNDGLGAYSFA